MIDSHCHLAGPEFAGDLGEVIARARGAGVAHALVILAADDDEEIERSAGVLAGWPEARAAVGVHPHTARRFAADPDEAARAVAREIDRQPLSRAIGEIGLDYHYDFSPRDVQQAVFRAQIRLAVRRGLPVVIHTREADDDTFRILEEERAAVAGGVFHCFTGTVASARRAVEMGFHLSLAGIVTFPKAIALKDVARTVPLHRLLIETDSPFLAPVPFRGRRNEPAYVRRVAEAVAELRQVPVEVLAAAVTANYVRLFAP